VALFDPRGPGNAQSSSGGESRVIRISYGGDPLYSGMALDSLPQWRALSQRQPLPILHTPGVLWFSPAGDAYMAKSLQWLSARGIAHRGGGTAWLRATFPKMRFHEGEAGFVETGSGGLMAGRGVQAVVADAGLAPARAAVGPPQKRPDGRYAIPGGSARSLVYACGPWLPKLFPDVLGGRILATRQEVFHFGGDGADYPVWADFNAGKIVYGLPDLEGQGFKLAFDEHGPLVDPDALDRRVSEQGVTRARAYLAVRFPELAQAPLVHSRVCQYENSSNGDFLLDRLPGHERVWLVGGGSGHGFKQGPAMGARAARHAAEPAFPVEPRFALAAKATVEKRTVF